MELSRMEGIIPALEVRHAVAHAMKIAKDMPKDKNILVNLSGRGDDADFVAEKLCVIIGRFIIVPSLRMKNK